MLKSILKEYPDLAGSLSALIGMENSSVNLSFYENFLSWGIGTRTAEESLILLCTGLSEYKSLEHNLDENCTIACSFSLIYFG